jgi:predicted extracellular nuclease
VARHRPGQRLGRRRARRQHPQRLPLQPGARHLRGPAGRRLHHGCRGRQRRHEGRRLSVSPGRIDPTSDAWTSSRKPLVGEFVFRGKQVFVVGNHFNSKGGDQPVHGAFQPPTLGSETQRTAQAKEVNTFVSGLLVQDPKAKVVVLGDLNDYQFSQPLAALTSGGVLTDLINTLPVNERYSYVYDGNSQTLDHILVSPAIKKPDHQVVHINAEFSDQTSDHDPQVVRFK